MFTHFLVHQPHIIPYGMGQGQDRFLGLGLLHTVAGIPPGTPSQHIPTPCPGPPSQCFSATTRGSSRASSGRPRGCTQPGRDRCSSCCSRLSISLAVGSSRLGVIEALQQLNDSGLATARETHQSHLGKLAPGRDMSHATRMFQVSSSMGVGGHPHQTGW